MDLIKSLQQIGLTEPQSKVYLACLQLGFGTVLNIAKAAEIKRPTTYLLLDELEAVGLVSKVKKGTKTLFKGEEPERITSGIKMKLQTADAILPSLRAIYNIDPEKPNIKIAEGVSGVRNIYNNIFTYLMLHPGEELLIYGSLKDAAENFRSSVVDYFYETMSKSKNPIREIGNDDYETRSYFRRSIKINPNHYIRLIRHEGRFFQTDNMIYGNSLVIFSVKKEIFATIIESKSIVETYRTLFNMAWNSGRPL